MSHGNRAAIMFAVGVFAGVMSIPALGQILPDVQGNRGSSWTPPPRFMEDRRPAPPTAAPTPGLGAGAGLLPGGLTQMQAMNLLAAEGFTDILPPVPTAYGGWIASASRQGRMVRATVDAQGKIAVRE